MKVIQPGDLVARKSYGCDVVFRVKDIITGQNGRLLALIKGVEIRLFADAPLEDLELVMELDFYRQRHDGCDRNTDKMKNITEKRKLSGCKGLWRSQALSAREEEYFDVPGRVLHIDGDEDYLAKCLDAYQKLKIPCQGQSIPEKDQAGAITYFLQKYQPDILVITGHDGLIKDARDFRSIDSYRNSRHFAAAVRAARRYVPGRDELVIFAGACQSHYEELLAAGANFASSPRRVFIHIFDPVFIVEKIAFTSIKETLTITDVLANTVTGVDGVGGIETRGRFRLGYPKSPY
jgi:spore coat assembly protein